MTHNNKNNRFAETLQIAWTNETAKRFWSVPGGDGSHSRINACTSLVASEPYQSQRAYFARFETTTYSHSTAD